MDGCIDFAADTVLLEHEYTLAVQDRIGSAVLAEPALCRLCGECLDVQAAHASCCAQFEATRGHYQVVHILTPVMKIVDPGLATE
eukprot:4386305-Karenia_brevis.AAC.1